MFGIRFTVAPQNRQAASARRSRRRNGGPPGARCPRQPSPAMGKPPPRSHLAPSVRPRRRAAPGVDVVAQIVGEPYTALERLAPMGICCPSSA
jgi:hypothetical protein